MLIIATSFRKEYDSKTNLSLFIDSYHFLCEKGLKPSIGIGAYEGEEELSFYFEISPFAFLPEVITHFLEVRKQECILVKRGERSNYCYLLYSDSEKPEEFIGEWKEVSKQEALSSSNYSCFNGSYYVVS